MSLAAVMIEVVRSDALGKILTFFLTLSLVLGVRVGCHLFGMLILINHVRIGSLLP